MPVAVGRPRLSICIPTFNMGRWLKDAVESALAVGHTEDVEIVVVDNCSTDDTPAVLESLGAQPNLRIVHATEHVDMIANFNRAARLGRAHWLTLLSADDVLSPSYFENLETGLDASEAAALSQIASADWGDHVVPFGPGEPCKFDAVGFASTLGDAACISTTAFRRDLFDVVDGFDADAGLLFDFDFFFRIAHSSGLPIRALGTHGGSYYPRRGSSWQDLEATGEATELLLRWIELRRTDLGPAGARSAERMLARRALGTGTTKLAAGDREEARRDFQIAATCFTQGRVRCEDGAAWIASRLPVALGKAARRARDRSKTRAGGPARAR